MFGSIFRMQAKPGKKQELIQLLTTLEGHQPPGMLAAYVCDTGGDEMWGVAVFQDEASYRKNAESPEQDREYRKMRELLTADPEWHDATIMPWPGNRG